MKFILMAHATALLSSSAVTKRSFFSAKAQGSPLSFSSQGSQQLPTKTWLPAQLCSWMLQKHSCIDIFSLFLFVHLQLGSARSAPAHVQDCRAAPVLAPALVLHHLVLRVGESLRFAWTPSPASGLLMSTPDILTSTKSPCPS